jgi:hypothetical protein
MDRLRAAIVVVLENGAMLPMVTRLVRHWRPEVADRLLDPFELVSKVLNLGVVGLILATQFRMLTEIRLRGFAGIAWQQ